MIEKTNIDTENKVEQTGSNSKIDKERTKNRTTIKDKCMDDSKRKRNPDWSDSNNGLRNCGKLCKDEIGGGIMEVSEDCDNPIAPQSNNGNMVDRSDSYNTTEMGKKGRGGFSEEDGTDCDNHCYQKKEGERLKRRGKERYHQLSEEISDCENWDSQNNDENDEKISNWGDPGEYSSMSEGSHKLGYVNEGIRNEFDSGEMTVAVAKEGGIDCNPSQLLEGVGSVRSEVVDCLGNHAEDSRREVTQYEEIKNARWDLSGETIGPKKHETWTGINVWLKKRSGLIWLKRVREEGLVLRYHFNMFDQQVSDVSQKMDNRDIFHTLKRAALRSGHELKLVRSAPNDSKEELQICPSTDSSIKLTWFLDEDMVKLKESATPDTTRKVAYRDILRTKGSYTGKKKEKDGGEDQITQIKALDHVGLAWILKMHAKQEIFDITGRPPPSEGEIQWASQKFKTIGKSGKIDLLKYLAYKTGSQLTIHMEGRKKKNLTRPAQKHTRLVYTDNTDEILIIRKGLRPKESSLPASVPKVQDNHEEMVNQSGIPIHAPSLAAPMEKTRLMDKSPEVNYLRHICRQSKGNQYPPRMVSNRFEHLRQFMSIEPSEYDQAGDGLFARGKRFIRDEIVGVYEGFVTTDTDQPYVLGIARKDQETLYVDADPNKGKRISLFGKMNEDLHRGRYNAELGEDGFIRILEDCEDEELFTRYWGKYNWDFLKQRSLAALHKEISTELPGMEKLVTANWNSLIMDKGQLSKWIRKLVDGNTKPNELHGIRCWIGEHPKGLEDLIGFLTYGPNSVRYHYKHWGHPFTPPTTNQRRKSRLVG